MTASEWTVVIGGGALGYWLVSVMWPHLRAAQGRTEPPPVPHVAAPWHEVLGVPRDANRETVVAAYQARIAEYRPERIADLPRDMQALARHRIEELELAYDAALRDLEWLRPRE
jgi:DnaJ-domain-containing protein 1